MSQETHSRERIRTHMYRWVWAQFFRRLLVIMLIMLPLTLLNPTARGELFWFFWLSGPVGVFLFHLLLVWPDEKKQIDATIDEVLRQRQIDALMGREEDDDEEDLA